jgi:hypothetical protein
MKHKESLPVSLQLAWRQPLSALLCFSCDTRWTGQCYSFFLAGYFAAAYGPQVEEPWGMVYMHRLCPLLSPSPATRPRSSDFCRSEPLIYEEYLVKLFSTRARQLQSRNDCV